eukprot:Gb_16382 [translate_table: standard]
MGSQTESRVMVSQSSMTPSLSGGTKMGGFPLARQASIYSLTLDEFQNTLGEPGKNFGSMNMDEFLKNIWTAEESQAMAAAMGAFEGGSGANLARQASLQRQGSLTLPRTLSRKTVDDVWRDIHRDGAEGNGNGTATQPRQATFGEMTLEDFLVKAGVVREESEHGGGQSFGSFRNGLDGEFGGNLIERNGDRLSIGNALGLGFSERGARNGEVGHSKSGAGGMPALSLSPTNALPNHATMDAMNLDAFKQQQQQADWLNSHYRSATAAALAQQQQLLHHQAAADAAAAAVYGPNAKRVVGNGALMGQGGLGGGLALGGGMGNGGLPGGLGGVGGFGAPPLTIRAGSPASPLSSDGVGPSHVDNPTISPIPYGFDGGFRGRKRGIEGPVEKVVERRQRRMIKNRESAARSRARKQAYTVELEAEVTQLKEENMKLRKQQEEMAERRKKQILEMMAPLAQQLGTKTRVLRRTLTGPW